MDAALHKEAILKVRLKPWLDEAYVVIWNIEVNIANLQEMQKNLQAESAGVVTEKTMEDTK